MLVEVLTPLIPKMEELVKLLRDTDWGAIGETILGAFKPVKALFDGLYMVADETAQLS